MLLLAMGLALGRLSAAHDRAAMPAVPAESTLHESPTLPADPPRPSASRSREGAARAAAGALSSLADPRLLADSARRRAVVAEIAPPAYRAELDPLFERSYGYLAGVLGASAERGDVVLQMTPVGYRVEAFSPTRATVAIWQVTLLATPERAPIAAWSTSRAELAWSGGRWTLERFGTDTPGPTPSVTAPATVTPPGEFVGAAQGFSPFAP